MKRRLYAIPTILVAAFALYLIGCNSASDEKKNKPVQLLKQRQ